MANTAPYAQQLTSAYAQMGSNPMAPQSGSSASQPSGDWWSQAYSSSMGASPQSSSSNTGGKSNQDFASGSMKTITDSQSKLMGQQADLNLRNAQQIMAAEHGYGLAGMTHANELGKDMLQNQTASNVRELQETGLQQRLGTQESGFQERQGMAETGYQQRAGARVTGQESRALVRTQGDEARRNVTHDRNDALSRAITLNRR